MGSHAARERELLEQFFETRDIPGNFRVNFGVAAVQIGVGHHNLAAVAWSFYIEHIQIIFGNNAVEVRINEVLAGNRSPVPDRFDFNVSILQRFS
ncbi:hypothetical protein D3C75_378070 [compost metagenome]